MVQNFPAVWTNRNERTNLKRYDCCRLRGDMLKPQLIKLDFMASQCFV